MMARSTNAPFKGRIQKRKTNRLQIIKSSLQRTAGPYKCANIGNTGRDVAAEAEAAELFWRSIRQNEERDVWMRAHEM
jgi:hypothetical protein